MGHLRIEAPDWAAFDLASNNGTLPGFTSPPPRPLGPVHGLVHLRGLAAN